jgi:hypothetical protein
MARKAHEETFEAMKAALDAVKAAKAAPEGDVEAAIANFKAADDAHEKAWEACRRLAVTDLLGGKRKIIKGKRAIEFLTGGEERLALSYLAWELKNVREPLDEGLRIQLAILLDPYTSPTRASRKLVFASRRGRGRKGHEEIIPFVVGDIMRAAIRGDGVESALATAAEKYGVSRSTAIKAWSKHKAQRGVAAFIRRKQERLRGGVK